MTARVLDIGDEKEHYVCAKCAAHYRNSPTSIEGKRCPEPVRPPPICLSMQRESSDSSSSDVDHPGSGAGEPSASCWLMGTSESPQRQRAAPFSGAQGGTWWPEALWDGLSTAFGSFAISTEEFSKHKSTCQDDARAQDGEGSSAVCPSAIGNKTARPTLWVLV